MTEKKPKKENKERQICLLIENSLADEFMQVCKANDITASQVLRSFIRDYIKKNSPK